MIALLASFVLSLGPAMARGDEASEHFTFGISFGVVNPVGDLSDDYKPGGTGAAYLGFVGRRFGGQISMGSVEPGTRNSTDAAYSALLGTPVSVSLAIVPVELQAVAAFPSETSRIALALHAGAGLHNVTVRLKGTDHKVDDDNRFGYSAGAGVRYAFTESPAMLVGLRGAFHGTGSMRYLDAQLELAFVF